MPPRAYPPGRRDHGASYRFTPRATPPRWWKALAALVDQTRFTGYINVLDGADTLVIQMRAGAGA